jgi:hypothetical protein
VALTLDTSSRRSSGGCVIFGWGRRGGERGVLAQVEEWMLSL